MMRHDKEERLRRWMTYISDEVRAVCIEKGWRHQVRRKWDLREKPVSESGIDDYEWKLIPDVKLPSGEWKYFVLGVDSARCVFIFQHDTVRVGMLYDWWFLSTFTEVDVKAALLRDEMMAARALESPYSMDPAACMDRLPHGLLRRFLSPLTEQWHPNHYCVT